MTTRAFAGKPRPGRAMGPWRLEWLRMTRSPRGIALVAVYLFFGFTGPLMAKYLAQFAKHASAGVTIIVPPPRAADGIVNFVSQGSQTGMIVLIVIASGVLSFDARRGLAMFYRTRVSGPFALIWPRFVATVVLAVTAYLVGTVAAWFETALVLGRLPADRVLLGIALETVFLVFAVAVVAAAAGIGRSTLSTAGVSLAVLLVALPVAGIAKGVAGWLPSVLLAAPAVLVTDAAPDYHLKAVAVSMVATVVLLMVAVRRARDREL